MNEIINKIYELKYKAFGEISIRCYFNDMQYDMYLMTAECGRNKSLMKMIGTWRKQNEFAFVNRFPLSVEGTTKWFKENVIEMPDRLLFLISVRGEYIGHLGLFRFDFARHTCEVDNVVRGIPKYPGLMGNAVFCMMEWGKVNLDLHQYSLKVLSDNKRAIRFYTRLWFKEHSRIPCEGAPEKQYIVMREV
jgi:RimJ/RimL family protein N-acetyltransferase